MFDVFCSIQDLWFGDFKFQPIKKNKSSLGIIITVLWLKLYFSNDTSKQIIIVNPAVHHKISRMKLVNWIWVNVLLLNRANKPRLLGYIVIYPPYPLLRTCTSLHNIYHQGGVYHTTCCPSLFAQLVNRIRWTDWFVGIPKLVGTRGHQLVLLLQPTIRIYGKFSSLSQLLWRVMFLVYGYYRYGYHKVAPTF